MIAEPIAARAAVRALSRMPELDPCGITDEASMLDVCERSDCLRVTRWDGPRLLGTAVMVVRQEKGAAAIYWAQGRGEGMTQAMDAVGREWGRQRGCTDILCQTARPGLRKRLEQAGWSVSGWIMKDTI